MTIQRAAAAAGAHGAAQLQVVDAVMLQARPSCAGWLPQTDQPVHGHHGAHARPPPQSSREPQRQRWHAGVIKLVEAGSKEYAYDVRSCVRYVLYGLCTYV